MKKIQMIVLLVVLSISSLVGAEVISSDDAIVIEELTGKIFQEYGLEIYGEGRISFSKERGSARVYIILVNNNALYTFFPVRNFNRKGEKDYVGYRNYSDEVFDKIPKGFEKNFWGNEKETFEEIQNVHQEIPVWGLYCYEIELLITFFKDVSIGVGIIPHPEVTEEIYSIGLNQFLKKEEFETVKKLVEGVKGIITRK